MKKLFLSTTAVALIASASVYAQTTTPAPSTPPAATQPGTTTAPSATQPSMTTPSTTTPSMNTPSATGPSTNAPITLTEQQAKDWIDKVVYTNDGKNVGEVAAVKRDSSGKVTELHVDVGGLMGIGETRVRLMPNQFRMATDRVTVSLSETEIKALPPIAK